MSNSSRLGCTTAGVCFVFEAKKKRSDVGSKVLITSLSAHWAGTEMSCDTCRYTKLTWLKYRETTVSTTTFHAAQGRVYNLLDRSDDTDRCGASTSKPRRGKQLAHALHACRELSLRKYCRLQVSQRAVRRYSTLNTNVLQIRGMLCRSHVKRFMHACPRSPPVSLSQTGDLRDPPAEIMWENGDSGPQHKTTATVANPKARF